VKRQALYFTAPSSVEVREDPLPQPGPGQLLVRTLVSAISAGTELLIYRGQAPPGMRVDETISSLNGTIGFPMRYGYAAVGEIAATGPGVAAIWQGRIVFAFHPHESFFLADVEEVHLLPPDMAPEEAVFFPNVETAVTLVADGSPSIGEQVAVFGQGIVGLLVTSLLVRHPLSSLVTLDAHLLRRSASVSVGAHSSLDPNSSGVLEEALASLQGPRVYRGADLTYEVSGNPDALDQAIAVTGYNGRVVIGSWYGRKPVTIELGGPFHRSRIRLISSQVSSIEPERRGRWTKERLQQLAWHMVKELKPSRFITHRFALSEAADAYQLLDRNAQEALQVVLTYPG
jgi:2-desacetyl-2-hydroxyethyl bacteriochlorophyllide A dehydrogenase